MKTKNKSFKEMFSKARKTRAYKDEMAALVSKERSKFLDDNEAAIIRQVPALAPLRELLLSLGGRWTLMPVVEEDLGRLLKRGVAWRGRPLLRLGTPSRCHNNASNLWDANKDILEIMTGYGLSKDGIWRQHSWCWWPARGKVVETTEARVAYYGYRMNGAEAERFWIDNAL
jgi:hypothetical protein